MKFFQANKSRKYIKRIFKFSVLIFLIEIFSINTFLETNKRISAKDLKNDQINKQIISREISDIKLIAKEISVAIVGATRGTGVLYNRKQLYHDEIYRFIGYEYEIITAWHVVKDNTSGEEISLILKDGSEYSVEISDIKRIEGLDFAVIKFISRKKYKTAFELNPESSIDYSMPLFRKKRIFIAGFPFKSGNSIKITEGNLVGESYWGTEGYNLFYDAPTEKGMSGGPILDENGKFIGIHGRGEKDIKRTNFRGYTIKTGVNSGLSYSHIYRLDDFFKSYNNLSTDEPEEDSLEAIEYFIIKANIEIRKNSGEKKSAIFYYDKAISMAERIFSDNYIDNAMLSGFYVNRANLKKEEEDFKGAEKDFLTAKNLAPDRLNRIYIASLEIPFYSEINNPTKVEKLAIELRKDLIKELKEIENFRNGDDTIDRHFEIYKNNEEELSNYEGFILALYNFTDNALSNISYQEKINNYTEVINLLKKINNKHENLYFLHSQRAKIKENQKDYKGALIDYDVALELNNKNSDLFLDRANLKLKLDDTFGAIEDINKSLKINDLNIESYLLRAKINSSRGKDNDAYDDIEKIKKLYKDKKNFKFITSDINFQLGEIFLVLKNYEYAEEEYSKVIDRINFSISDKSPVDLEKNKDLLINKKLAYWGRAIARENLNNITDAILDYKIVLGIEPKNISVLEILGDLNQELGNYNQALEYFNKVIKLEPNNAYYLSKRAYQKGLLNNDKGAIDDLNRAIDIDPNNSINFLNRGIAESNLGNLKNAIFNYKKSLDIDPDNKIVYESLCKASYFLKEYEESIKYCIDSINLNNNKPFINLYLADSFLQNDESKKALKVLDDIKKRSRDQNYYFLKGNILQSLNNHDKAIENYNKAINIEKNFIGAFINRAWSRYQTNDLDGALSDTDKVLNLEINNSFALNTRGLTKYKLGDFINGCLDLQKASNLDLKEAKEYLKSKEGKWCNKD